MNWKFFVSLAVGFLESAGAAKIAEDDNDTGTDDIIGQGLVFASKFVRWLLAGAKGDAPKVPPVVAKGQ